MIIEDIVKVKVTDHVHSLRFSGSDFVNVDGVRYVKLPWGSFQRDSFVRVVLEKVDTYDKDGDTCRTSIGYDQLIAIRNDTSARLDRSKVANGLLINAATHEADQSVAKRTRISRSTLRELRETHISIDVVVPPTDGHDEFTVKMIKPAHHQDSLRVQFDVTTLSNIIEYIRRCGFNASYKKERKAHDAGLPTGIRLRQVGEHNLYIVKEQAKHFSFWNVKDAMDKQCDTINDVDNGGVSHDSHHAHDINIVDKVNIDHTDSTGTDSFTDTPTTSVTHTTPTKQMKLGNFFKARRLHDTSV